VLEIVIESVNEGILIGEQRMRKIVGVISFWILLVASVAPVYSQDNQAAQSKGGDLKTVVVASKAKTDSVIVIPPSTSVSFSLTADKHANKADEIDLPNWLSKQLPLNGLESPDLQP
jgi:hypothetical protein